jgi:hypothetical protein
LYKRCDLHAGITTARIQTHTQYVITIIANNNAKYFVVQHECKENPLLNLHGNNEYFYIVDSFICANNNKM